MKFDSTMISALLAAFAPVAGLVLAVYSDRVRRKKTEKPPQSEKILRPPGYSLSNKLDETLDAGVFDALTACALSLLAFPFLQATILFIRAIAPPSWLAFCIFNAGVFVGLGVVSVRRAYGKYQDAQNIRLGLRGEQAVAESLSEAADSGFRAFHDLPGGDNWNIDHVAVGTRGVFLIETKARRKRGSNNGQAAHEVLYDGEALQFPRGRDAKPIEQAKRNAAWLADYLRNETGDPVEVFPLVVLPGWFVKKSERGNFRVNVINANYLPGYLGRQAKKLEPAQVRRIITALDKKCRDVEF